MHGRILASCLLLAAACESGEHDSASVTSATGASSITVIPETVSQGMPTETGSEGSGSGATGSGGESAMSWPQTTSGAPSDCPNVLKGALRDFQEAHPDFEYKIGDDPGIVLPDIGPDAKPVYAGEADNPTTTGQANFDQWYRDTPGVNQSSEFDITLTNAGNGVFVYDNMAFFPIDGQGFGNEGHRHNYHFTYEIHTQFVYKGGEVFTFRGDDDVWVYINGKLGIDLGGVHGPQMNSIDLDAFAPQAGITPGGAYPLDFFFAERHTSESNFRIETTIECLAPPG